MKTSRISERALMFGVLLFLVGCQSDRVPNSQPMRSSATAAAGTLPIRQTIVDHSAHGGQHFGGLRFFNVGEHRFETIDEFIRWVASLPEGSQLLWSSGCAYYERVPLKGSEMTMDEFKAFCVNHRIEFRWRYGY
jgi:hypothetical protein